MQITKYPYTKLIKIIDIIKLRSIVVYFNN